MWLLIIADPAEIQTYQIKPENTYNTDGKGYLIGFLQKHTRIIAKSAWEYITKLIGSQDGRREWIPIIACICVDRREASSDCGPSRCWASTRARG